MKKSPKAITMTEALNLFDKGEVIVIPMLELGKFLLSVPSSRKFSFIATTTRNQVAIQEIDIKEHERKAELDELVENNKAIKINLN